MSKKFIFVLMPFDSNFDDIYELGIKASVKNIDSKIVVQRLDEQLFSERMMSRIYSQIEKSDIIIADMTGKNPNVFYEVGYAHAKEKLTLLITKNSSDIPFDLQHYRHIVYGKKISDLKSELKKNLSWALEEVESNRKKPLEVDINVDGTLNKSDYFATANINLKIDLTNKFENKTININSIYLYTQDGWVYNQNKSKCPQRKSDLTKYHIKHQIIPQMSKLSKKQWYQIQLDGSREIADVFDGDELYDKYNLQGIIGIRIVTDNGSFDYKKSLELTVESIPF